MLRRVHGGAIPVERLGIELPVDQRYGQNAAQKDRIAKPALDQLPDGGSIIIDAGTTHRPVRRAAAGRPRIHRRHPRPADRRLLAERPNITLHLVGGQIRAGTLAAVGSWAAA